MCDSIPQEYLDEAIRRCSADVAELVAERDRLLAEIGEAGSHELTDVEVEAALVGEGIHTWGPDAERFERMFAAAMKCRAALSKHGAGEA